MAVIMATQTRISTTKAILNSIKNIKMMGPVEKMEAKILTTRGNEMKNIVAFFQLMAAFMISGKQACSVRVCEKCPNNNLCSHGFDLILSFAASNLSM